MLTVLPSLMRFQRQLAWLMRFMSILLPHPHGHSTTAHRGIPDFTTMNIAEPRRLGNSFIEATQWTREILSMESAKKSGVDRIIT